MRPLRDTVEKASDKIPRGPLGILGKGNAIGGANYFTVALINGLVPVDGLEVGFNIESHNVERSGDEELHTFVIQASNKDLARFISKYESSPTNLDFFKNRTEVLEVERVDGSFVFPRWETKTRVTKMTA